MLGARTKQVFSYGRRGQRIVNVSDRADSNRESDRTSTNPFESPNKLKRRENIISLLSPSSPRARVQRKVKPKRSPAKSPLAVAAKKKRLASDVPKKTLLSKLEAQTPLRQPLTPLHSNYASPNLPLHAAKKRSARIPGSKGIPTKPTSPLVALDIIVLDDRGRRLSQERRVSRTDVQTNPVTSVPGKRKGKGAAPLAKRLNSPSHPIIIDSDSEVENTVPRPPKKLAGRSKAIIVISSDESEVEEVAPRARAAPAETSSRLAATRPAPRLQVEVVIPPPTFKIPKLKPKPPPAPPSPPSPAQLPPPVYAPNLPPPTTKARPLTPIKRGANRALFQRSFPTPSTPTDCDLSLEFEKLDLSSAEELDEPTTSPDYLLPLLSECAQTTPHEFSAFIETFPFDPIVQPTENDDGDGEVRFRKIGEASYSEVFGIGDVVLKVIPLRDEEGKASGGGGDVDTPAPSDAKDVLKEIIVTREMGEVCTGFVKLLRAYVVRGRYPSLLLKLWDEYNERKGSESIRPDMFSVSQVYAIIVLPNGGPDLEAFTFKTPAKTGWHQACSLFWQVARALEQAEDLVSFEHRDLHWGQILVKNVPARKKSVAGKKAKKMPMDDVRFGVKATIIDLGLSRMDALDGEGSKTYWTPFEEEIFEGEGDYQFDVYRMMRAYNGDSWEEYRPFTNVMWLHYLAQKLLHSKRLKPPAAPKRGTSADMAGNISAMGYEEKECHDCLVEMERVLKDALVAGKGSGRRKTCVPAAGPRTAGEVVLYGVKKGWMK
ncbi:hypothetical protein BV22DRAFT_1000095 [Leucogyrophana mollusca]|uniref:Uncharacterized protein n=1 Tax=Leucogyrophana mollusca TaxID=85980 RepID=A0ACB8BZS7_9AGAM|nr:hypothetical protein BV22DRAFT_1000095 [Leucogyrophana mollusca]